MHTLNRDNAFVPVVRKPFLLGLLPAPHLCRAAGGLPLLPPCAGTFHGGSQEQALHSGPTYEPRIGKPS